MVVGDRTHDQGRITCARWCISRSRRRTSTERKASTLHLRVAAAHDADGRWRVRDGGNHPGGRADADAHRAGAINGGMMQRDDRTPGTGNHDRCRGHRRCPDGDRERRGHHGHAENGDPGHGRIRIFQGSGGQRARPVGDHCLAAPNCVPTGLSRGVAGEATTPWKGSELLIRGTDPKPRVSAALTQRPEFRYSSSPLRMTHCLEASNL